MWQTLNGQRILVLEKGCSSSQFPRKHSTMASADVNDAMSTEAVLDIAMGDMLDLCTSTISLLRWIVTKQLRYRASHFCIALCPVIYVLLNAATPFARES